LNLLILWILLFYYYCNFIPGRRTTALIREASVIPASFLDHGRTATTDPRCFPQEQSLTNLEAFVEMLGQGDL